MTNEPNQRTKLPADARVKFPPSERAAAREAWLQVLQRRAKAGDAEAAARVAEIMAHKQRRREKNAMKRQRSAAKRERLLSHLDSYRLRSRRVLGMASREQLVERVIALEMANYSTVLNAQGLAEDLRVAKARERFAIYKLEQAMGPVPAEAASIAGPTDAVLC